MPAKHGYIAVLTGAPMLLSLFLGWLNRAPRFVWAPSLDLSDHAIYSTLLPGTQY
jgi:hypothetical protein